MISGEIVPPEDRVVGRVAWWRYDDLAGKLQGIEGHGLCEAPRHRRFGFAALYVCVIIDEYDTKHVQGMCIACMTFIARDMNTTPEDGKLEWGKAE